MASDQISGRSVRQPSGGFPVVAALIVGAGVALGVIAGSAIWKSGGAEPQGTDSAIVQNAPGQQDNDPAGNESEPGDDAPVKQDKITAPIVQLQGKENKADDDVPVKQDKATTPVVLLKGKESKPDNDVPPAQRRLNLMSIVSLNVDLVEGKNKWRLQDQTLICAAGHFVPRVQIRFVPPEEYDLSVTFTQTKNLRNGVTLIMPKPGGGMFFWTVGMRNGKGYGFGPQGQNCGGDIAKLIQINREYTTTVQVRRNGVAGLLDGALLISHPTDFRDLTTDSWHRMPNERVLGVGCDDPTTFHHIVLLEVTGQGKAIR